ncbi:MAG: ABC transporter ATP-binding protein, partial [Chthonomonadales bacterium]
FVAIVGPSGCGKTTLLNLLSGHDKPTSGEVERHGVVRQVYQQDGLFPWMTVSQNIALGVAESERATAVSEMLALIRMESFGEHFPHQLSGGMRQRVELARALAGQSDILLMDEPFSALDYISRLRIRNEVAHLIRERPRTVVLVTHDIEEAAQLADRVLVLSERPARIVKELVIKLPRPRELTHPEVVGAIHDTLMQLGLESAIAN